MQMAQRGQCSPLQRQRPLTPLTQTRLHSRRALNRAAAPRALFGRKQAKEEPPPPPPKKGLFGRGKAAQSAVKEAPKQARGLFQKAEKAAKSVAQKPKQTFLEAIDFAEVASYKDAKLLSDAKYGALKGGRMSKEQAGALKRKVGGTAKNYFKEWVDVRGSYTDKGYVSKEPSTLSEGVPGLPFLVGVVLALFGALGYVVSQTS